MKILKPIFVIGLVLGGLATALAQEKVLLESHAALAEQLRPQVLEWMRENQVQGLSLALVRGDSVVWAEGFGWAGEGVPADAQTLYRLGSISKMVTAIGVLRLAEQGKIGLDEPFEGQLSGFEIENPYSVSQPFTPRDMLCHYSGLPSDVFKGFFTRRESVPMAQLLECVPNERTTYPPGHAFSYSNLGFGLLGLLVEQQSGLPFDSFARQQILRPLGMERSAFSDPEGEERLSQVFEKGKPASPDPHIRDVSAGMLSSDVLDMARFMRFFWGQGMVDGQALLTAESYAHMTRPNYPGNPIGYRDRVGLGCFLSHPELAHGGTFVGHGGDTEFFHADLKMLTDKRLGAIVLTNSNTGGAVASKVAEALLLAALAQEGVPAPPPPDMPSRDKAPRPALDSLAGAYASPLGLLPVWERRGRLFMRLQGLKFRLIPQADSAMALQLRLLGLRIVLEGQAIRFIDHGPDRVMMIADKPLGLRVEPQPIDPLWLGRQGRYELLNLADEAAYFEKVRIRHKRGFLQLEARFFGSKMRFLLDPTDDQWATRLGIGRSQNESIRFLTDENGQETLYFSGFLLRKK